MLPTKRRLLPGDVFEVIVDLVVVVVVVVVDEDDEDDFVGVVLIGFLWRREEQTPIRSSLNSATKE